MFTNDTFTTQWVAGGLIGGQIGCNYQMSFVVIGLEIESSWISASKSNAPTGAISQINSITDVAFRLGFTIDRVLFYAKGGAGASYHTFAFHNDATFANQDPINKGMLLGIAGIGLEYLITPHVTAKIEADLTYSPTITLFTNTPFFCCFFPGVPVTYSARVISTVVKTGLNLKF